MSLLEVVINLDDPKNLNYDTVLIFVKNNLIQSCQESHGVFIRKAKNSIQRQQISHIEADCRSLDRA